MRSTRLEVPFDRDGSGRFLPWLVAFMVYLAALSLLSALAMNKALDRWDRGLSGQMTVQIPPPDPDADRGLREKRLDAAIDVLTQTKGVRSAIVLDKADINGLLSPWLGPGTLDEELPLPDLIAVEFDPAESPDMTALTARLDKAAPGAIADNHRGFLERLIGLTRSLQLVAIVVVALVGISAVLAVIFVTNTGLSIHRHVIEVLHLIGAQDDYVAQQFQRYAFKLGLRGGLIGLALAVPTVLLIRSQLEAGKIAILPQLTLSPVDWALVALLPLAAAVVAMLTARFTVLRALVRMI